MDNAAIISGFSVCLPFAENPVQLIQNLRQGKCVERKPWFKSDDEAITCGFKQNKRIATLDYTDEGVAERLYRLIDNALHQARLDRGCLTGSDVRVYLTGIGPRIDGMAYKSFYNKNDLEDIQLSTSLTRLHVENMSQDRLAGDLARRYGLQYLPPNMNCTSNSSLTAVHIGCQAIEHHGVDLVMVINCSEIKTQDLWFLNNQSMLETDSVQPFGENSNGVVFAEGFSVLLIESARHRCARQIHGGIRLQTTYSQISAGRSNDSAWLSANTVKVMQSAMKKAQRNTDELCAIIPHGNGSFISDRAEAKAIAIFEEGHTIPVLAYKGQIGYTATGSGIVDLIIGHHTLCNREIISPVAKDNIIDAVANYVWINRSVTNHNKRHLLKTGVGVDGSIIGVVMSDIDRDR
ncbi:3-oxoacyl-(acyl-carrier-protein) synthase [Izhakiella capsodis]|uniref:3-oxoacyl-(Acyl-carrier-protein) synthase n=1 Tax=Izhakiella capsodis TaxID=1367852 RepID=A0A1I4XDY8_9GAMM|nr:beta-ketoacyl synthase [Izhakiella capsodis]SFN24141.1 3-oxoacyl-(acyl-carrier-protein) synthase [Izhakiella capsodis]